MTPRDIIRKILREERTTKSREKLIRIQLVWYTREPWGEKYHFNLDCQHTSAIYRSNLEFGTEDAVKGAGYKRCTDCPNNREREVILTVRGG